MRVSNSILCKSNRGFVCIVKRAGLEAKNEPPGGRFSGQNRSGAGFPLTKLEESYSTNTYREVFIKNLGLLSLHFNRFDVTFSIRTSKTYAHSM